MNEAATLAVTIVGLAIILAVVGLMFYLIVEDIIRKALKERKRGKLSS